MTAQSNAEIRETIKNRLLDAAETQDWQRAADLTGSPSLWEGVLDLMADQMLALFHSQQQRLLQGLMEQKLWVDLGDDKKRNKTKWRMEAVPIQAIQNKLEWLS